MKKLFDPYIALMLMMIALAALLPVHGKAAPITAAITDVTIAFLFFLYGARLSPKAAIAGFIQWKLQIAVLLCTFVLFPVLGVGIARLTSGVMPQALLVGVVVLCLMPSTVQSSIAFTSIAKGGVAAALCATKFAQSSSRERMALCAGARTSARASRPASDASAATTSCRRRPCRCGRECCAGCRLRALPEPAQP